MRRPTTLTLRQRVFLTLLPLVALVVGLGGAGAALLRHLGGLSDEILRENYASVVAMERLNESLERIDSSFQFALAGQAASAVPQYEANWKSYGESLRVEQGNITVPGEREAVEKLTALTARYRTQGDAFYARALVDPQRQRDYFERDGLLDVFKGLKSASGEIREMNQANMEAASRRAKATAAASVTGLAAGLAAAVLLGAFLAWNTSRSLVAPIKALTKSAVGISEGNLEQTASYAARDELGALADAFNHMVAQLRASRRSVEQRTAELREAEAKYRSIFENAVEGIFQSTPDGRYLTVNHALAKMLGYASGRELMESIRHIGEQIYVDPQRRIELARRLVQDGVVHDFEALCLRKDKSTLWLSYNTRAVRGKDGAVLFYEGFVTDVSARKEAEQEVTRLAHLHAVVADLGQRALRLDPSMNIEDEAVQLVATTLDVEYANVMELLPDSRSFLLRAGVGWREGQVGYAIVASEGSQPAFTLASDRAVIVEDTSTETRFVAVAQTLGESVASTVSVVISTPQRPYGTLGVHARRRRTFTKDEVDFLQTVANVLGAAIERHRAEERLRRLNRAHSALSGCNHALIRASDELALVGQICRLIVEEAGHRLCWLGRAEHDEAKTVHPIASAGFDEGYLEGLHVTWADTERGRGPTGTCIRTGKVVVARNIATDPLLAPWRPEALRRGYASSIAIPIVLDGPPPGALTIYSAEPDAFADAEVALLTELAEDLAYGIATLRMRGERTRVLEELRVLNAELEMRVAGRTADLEAAYEREASIGAKIQQQLLLDEPPHDFPGLQLAALTVPSRRIGGDFYGFFGHEGKDCLDLLVADVMGKGVPAALLSAATKSQFPEALWHLMATSTTGELPEPREIVTLAHTHLARQLIDIESFVTLCYTRIDVARRRLEIVDCGHTGVLHLHARTGLCDVLHGENLPLGVREGEIYGQVSVPLEPEDIVVFYSDGVTEARNPARELFGVERLVACVRQHVAGEPAALIEAVREAVIAFSGARTFADDLTCVVAKLLPYEAPVARADIGIGSALSELHLAREFVEAFCEGLPDHRIAADGVASLVLAVDEAACNVMKHAYHGRDDQRIDITAEAFKDRVAVRLRYQGAPFDPSVIPPPSFDGSRESGFGMFMIAKSVDAVRYYKDDLQRSCIRLEKLREAA